MNILLVLFLIIVFIAVFAVFVLRKITSVFKCFEEDLFYDPLLEEELY